MRTISGTLQSHLASGLTTLAHLVRITRKDGTVLRFTNHSSEIVFSSNTYYPDDSVSLSAITTTANNGIQSTNCNVIFSDTAISAEHVARGLYDNAGVEISIVNYNNPSLGEILLMKGQLSVFELTDRQRGSFEIRGLLTRGDAHIGEYYSAECRNDLGDSRCGVSLGAYQMTGEIKQVVSATNFLIDLSGNPADGFFSFGVITMTSGENTNRSLEIMSQAAYDASWDRFILPLAFPFTPVVGDTCLVTAGCNKTFDNCKNKFSNYLNYRGERFVPGNDILTDILLPT